MEAGAAEEVRDIIEAVVAQAYGRTVRDVPRPRARMVSGRTRHPLNRLPPLHDAYRRCYRQLGVRGSAIVSLAIIDGVALEDIDRHHRWPKGTALRVLCAALDDYGWGLGRRWWLM